MPTAWFVTNFRLRDEPWGRPSRYCAMDDYTEQIILQDGGDWAETEVLGNYAVVKVQAQQATLDTIAADNDFFRIPLSLDDLLDQLTPAERTALYNHILAMGYGNEEILTVLGSDFRLITLGQALRFAATRRRKPRWDPIQEEIVLDGPIQACRSVDNVDQTIG